MPAVLVHAWSDPAVEVCPPETATALLALPGVVRLGPGRFAIVPVADDPGEMETALRCGERLLAARDGDRRAVLLLPVQVRLGPLGPKSPGPAELVAEPLLDDLEQQVPIVPWGAVYLSGYAMARAESRLEMKMCGLYEGPSGTRVTLFRPLRPRDDVRPWHNTHLVDRPLEYVPRPDLESELAAVCGAAAPPVLRITGAIGCGKTRLVWETLGPERRKTDGGGALCLWVSLRGRRDEPARPLAALRRQLVRLAGKDALAGLIQADAAPSDLPGLLARSLVLASRRAGAPLRLVCDDAHVADVETQRLIAGLAAHPEAGSSFSLVLVGRPRTFFQTLQAFQTLPAVWAGCPQVAGAPEVIVSPMAAAPLAALAGKLFHDLLMPAEVKQQIVEASGGFPLALEEELSRMIQRRQLRRCTHSFGNFFVSGRQEIDFEPSFHLIQEMCAEARALGDPTPLRLLALADTAVPSFALAEAALACDAAPPPGWEAPFLAGGWLRRSPSPWGIGVDFAATAYGRAMAATVDPEAAPGMRRALGEVLSAADDRPRGLWHAYRLLSGGPGAVPRILELAREHPQSLPAREVLDGLAWELAAHRERGGDQATEIQILWLLLPLARRLGRLERFEGDVARAVELAQLIQKDEPRKLLAFSGLKADLDLQKSRLADGERTLRAVLDQVLEADPSHQSLLLLQLGRLLARQERHKEARHLFENLLATVEERGSTALAATCRFHLGNIALREGRLREAQTYHREAMRMRRTEKNLKALGSSLSALGAVYSTLGAFPRALWYYQEAERVLREYGEDGEESFALFGLGRVLGLLGDATSAAEPLRRALALREGKADAVGEALARLQVAANHADLQNLDEALAEARRAHFQLSLAPESGILGDAEQLLGRIHFLLQQLDAAGESFATALEIHERHGDHGAALRDRSWLLETALANGEETEIRRLCRELEATLEAGVPALGGSFAVVDYRLARGWEWLRLNGRGGTDPARFFARAYQTLLDTASPLPEGLRRRFLLQVPENAAIVEAAASRHLVSQA